VLAHKARQPRLQVKPTLDGQKRGGGSVALSLISHIEAAYPPLEKTWGFAGAKWGWSLRLKQKKRTVLYMTPCSKHFLVGFALGEKAVKAAIARPLPDSILAIIEEAPRYAEGRGVRIEVRNKRELEAVKELASVKMTN
jgi:hypothetical protein